MQCTYTSNYNFPWNVTDNMYIFNWLLTVVSYSLKAHVTVLSDFTREFRSDFLEKLFLVLLRCMAAQTQLHDQWGGFFDCSRGTAIKFLSALVPTCLSCDLLWKKSELAVCKWLS